MPEGTQQDEPLVGELIQQMDRATEIVAYRAIDAELAQLRSRLHGVVYDVRSKAGNKSARIDRKECVDLRVRLEHLRQKVKAPALKYERLIDGEAARIKAAIVALEGPIDEQIKAEEARLAAIEAEKAEAERQRLALIGQRIDWIRARPFEAAGLSAGAVGEVLAQLEQLPMSVELYGERLLEAQTLRAATIDQLRDLAARLVTQETEAKRIADEAAALEARRQQQAKEDAERAERHRQEDAERQARANAEAEKAAERAIAQQQARSLIETLTMRLGMTATNANQPAIAQHLTSTHKQGEAVCWAVLAPFGGSQPDPPLHEEWRQLHIRALDHLTEQLRLRSEADTRAQAEEDRRRAARVELERLADPWAALQKISDTIMDNSRDDVEKVMAALDVAESALKARDALTELEAGCPPPTPK